MLFEKFMMSQAKRTVSLTVGKQGRKAHFIPSEYVSEDKDSVDRKEPIYTSLILSTPGPFTVGRKDKRRQEKAK